MDDRDDSRDVAAEQEQMHRDEVLFRIDRIEWCEWHIKSLEQEIEEHKAALRGLKGGE